MFKKLPINIEKRQLENMLDKFDMIIDITYHELINIGIIKQRLIGINNELKDGYTGAN